ncbi:bacterial regulatory s, luxR family protein [Clostridium argentinense CDC 2741]|uniref:Bacterial regulatory s, luxR family protein n=1 Tax=Clostridium argentinense CDC 2741 TaxID=1418104 RepID=A0A0C1TZ72_9CLOT|nr:sigma factor-like helix-turn-helix DNA-binding protein [Clostridium argentinense]KIE44548.1 bacterial regulatory s, luxR family protein [Clostridium argentinense CDC 2741]NFF38322.1 sigma-70 family RNA polymerase sigma factor [Clostridium argentinense]NFP49094.1 sigma-70 family RNA polymerase sigma factor [Clostridium argentinense]NFP71626.1 sigma-70 family RNA polymerase sigma factor [Clostridium argentinense]NFP74983.1 sigma-70 family RNA polymerase sigma factor [Clostridium argentinense]
MIDILDMEKLIKESVQITVREALIVLEKEKEKSAKLKRDRRLRNTALLLRNYINLKEHFNNAIYTNSQIEDEDPIEILMECDSFEEDLYINSIKRTHTRTKIIVNHIETILGFYKYRAFKSKDESAERRYEVIELLYMEGKTYEEVAEELGYSEKTISRDRKRAIEELSVLLFGIDGLKLEV